MIKTKSTLFGKSVAITGTSVEMPNVMRNQQATDAFVSGMSAENAGYNPNGAGWLNIEVEEAIVGGGTSSVEVHDSADGTTYAKVEGKDLKNVVAGAVTSLPLPDGLRSYIKVFIKNTTAASAGVVSASLGIKAPADNI